MRLCYEFQNQQILSYENRGPDSGLYVNFRSQDREFIKTRDHYNKSTIKKYR